MKFGRELDALIAEKVMGRSVPENERHHGPSYFDPPAYSTDISAAWEVVEKLKSQDWPRDSHTDSITGVDISFQKGMTEVRLMDQNHNTWELAVGDTAPHAICLAALKAIGIED